jgi:predicted ABC-type ATPase
MTKHLHVIAGPNGAGKTTFASKFLPDFAHCEAFVNADLIARGLSPFAPESAAIKAGKLVLQNIGELMQAGRSFGLETTLSGKSYQTLFKQAHQKRYRIHIFFIWLPNADLAVQRVADRVKQGGHSVPEMDIRRRYNRGIENFWNTYRLLIDDWIIFDNALNQMKKIAYGSKENFEIVEKSLFGTFLDGI